MAQATFLKTPEALRLRGFLQVVLLQAVRKGTYVVGRAAFRVTGSECRCRGQRKKDGLVVRNREIGLATGLVHLD